MRIVHIEDIFYPEAGYQVNILSKYEVMEGHDVYIITCPMEFWDEQRKEFWGRNNIVERDKKYENESGAKVIRFPTYKKYSSRILYKHGFSNYINELKPDILFIHAESSFVTLQFLLKLNKLKYPIIMDSHTLEMASTNKFRFQFYKIYKIIFTPIIEKNKLYIIRTQDDDFLMRRLGIPKELAPFISFGSDLSVFHPDIKVKECLRKELEISSNAFVVVNTGKLTEGKGGLILAEALREKFETDREVVLITVGTPTKDDYGVKVTKRFNDSKNRIIRIPTQKYYDLAKYYQSADLCVFARECSLSFYDAQACGLPVIVEDNQVNRDRVSHENGLTFISGNVNDLRYKIQMFIDMSNNEYQKYAKSSYDFIKADYNYEKISKEYTELMEDSIKRFKDKKR